MKYQTLLQNLITRRHISQHLPSVEGEGITIGEKTAVRCRSGFFNLVMLEPAHDDQLPEGIMTS